MKYRMNTQTYASSFLRRFTSNKDGTTAIEYALIASGLSIVIIVNVNGVGSAVVTMFQSVVDIF